MANDGKGCNPCKICEPVPARLNIGLQCFLATWCGFVVRIALSVLLLSMVFPETVEEARTTELKDYGPRYNWSQKVQGHVLAGYFYGSFVAPLVGGVLSELVGPRIVVGVTTLLSAVLMGLCPLAAHGGWEWLIGNRAITGFLGGTLYPALHSLVAQWAPPQEKGKFIWCLLGGTFGSVVTWPISTELTMLCGWKTTFYILGGIVGFWSLVWFVSVYNSPAKHPRISDDELDYITFSIAGTVSNERRVLPFLSALTSGPFIALVVLHYGSLGGLFFQLTEGPKYMMEVLDFNLRDSGGYACLPHLMRLLFGIIFSSVGDWCISDTSINKTLIRKLFVIPSHIIPGLLMVGMSYVERDEVLAVSLLSLSLGFNGAATVTNLANHHDLAPNHAGSLYGVMNTIGGSTGFLFPLLVGYMLDKKNSLQQWRTVFFVGAGLYLVSGLVFILFGSAETQPWNFKKDDTIY